MNKSTKDSAGTDVRNYNEKELAKQFKAQEKSENKRAKKEAKAARKGKKGQSDYTRLYRSRVTKWWRRDQNPKIGKYNKWKKDGLGH